ncbi:hypothetical protein R5W23_001220 [Gemmata sp. JC673]|uniref:Uncharacterized protein n=1 Tax=Gemmata algarum TaxID=2975278 RepID=A0ABU5EXH9_9BACT|nr:hypothetical protein [Gemmata algarum]MDY3560013.1 hypothetical protein [Gemmata algarum]
MPTAPDHDAVEASGTRPLRRPLVWWCAVCKRQELVDIDQLGRFFREGWPICCGEVALVCSRRCFVRPDGGVR